MADIVRQVLEKASKDAESFKTTEVHKAIELEIDVGNLLGVDNNPLDVPSGSKNRDKYVKAVTRDNVQLIMNKLWELPSERVEDAIVVKLPDPTIRVPRAKKLPVAKINTKWEEYAKTKGIHKTKKENLVWDELTKQWHPRHGYRRAPVGDENWVLEYKPNQDQYEDLFAKKKDEKSERVAKNELQRLRNIARSQKTKVPGVGITPTETPNIENLSKAATFARSSTASLGKFTENLPKEKPQKQKGIKRKFEPVIGDHRTEKQKSLDILEKIKAKEPKINLDQLKREGFTSIRRIGTLINIDLLQAEKNISGGNKKKSGKSGKSGRSHKNSSKNSAKKDAGSKKGKFGKAIKKNSQFKGKKGKK
ncbi:Ribosome biogenesis regulatory [Nymphon striatum]|nr:Ribosome biogenesis regulatory [Nymphon striatum]